MDEVEKRYMQQYMQSIYNAAVANEIVKSVINVNSELCRDEQRLHMECENSLNIDKIRDAYQNWVNMMSRNEILDDVFIAMFFKPAMCCTYGTYITQQRVEIFGL